MSSAAHLQIIRIKRKREEEPVDSLFLESTPGKRQLSSYIFHRRREETSVKGFDGADVNSIQPEVAPTTISSPPAPRRFYLDTSKTHGRSVPLPNGPRFSAVLVERAPEQIATSKTIQEQSAPSNLDGSDATASGTSSVLQTTRKRPKTRKQPVPNQRRVVQNDGAHDEDEDDAELIDALRAYAAELAPSGTGRGLEVANPKASNDPDIMDTSEDEYVYDTFIRQTSTTTADTTPTPQPTPQSLSDGNIGFVTLSDADELYLLENIILDEEDLVDEADWNSEQDDENAENYYGADYPEDELDSDDEFGYGTYTKFRKNASDDEEWGSADEEWSDEEDEKKQSESQRGFPWRRTAKVQGPFRSGSGEMEVDSEDES